MRQFVDQEAYAPGFFQNRIAAEDSRVEFTGGRLCACPDRMWWARAVDGQVTAKGRWVGTWATAVTPRVDPPPATQSPQGGAPNPEAGRAGQPGPQTLPNGQPIPATAQSMLHFNNQTLRQIVHISIGASKLRVAVSNTFGTSPLVIGAAQIALRDKEASIVPQSNRVLKFNGIAAPDGTASGIDKNLRWPDVLARRLAKAGVRVALMNAGVGGNRILDGGSPSALSRLDRDVLSQPGVTHVIFLEEAMGSAVDLSLFGAAKAASPPK